MKPMDRAPVSGTARFVLLAAALAAVQTAGAAPPQLRSDNGLLLLPNVRVENAAAPVEGRGTRSSAGVRAYKDRETGQLRKATPEEQQAEAQAPAPSNDPAGVRISVMPNGRKSAALDETFMSYSVVRRAADGTLDAQCVSGESAAQHALHAHPRANAKEHGHAR